MDNQTEIINTVKLLIYKENPSLLEKVDFEDDNIFLEPLLFAYFNSKKDNLFAAEMLTEILQGYFVEKEALQVQNSLGKDGIAYIPNMGYFNSQNEKVEEILKIDAFEIVKTCHPVMKKYFVEYYKGHILDSTPPHNPTWQNYYKELEEAICIIKENLPSFYSELVSSNNKIYLHDNPKIINFTTIETLGMLYLYVIGDNNLIYFIEELIHQGSHNFLCYVTHNRKDYFKIDVDNTVMRSLTGQEWDYRTVYGSFHGLFTVTQRVECFDILLSKDVFSGREKHELLGRLADQFLRFRTGLELIDLEGVFTDKGIKYYKSLDEKCMKILQKYDSLRDEFDLSHRDLDFRYNDFCMTNSYNEFLKKDKKGIYNFLIN
ncbi:hypothetical protein [Flavobacterium sp. C4GT6]|uniref:hypothetical protein n=1 Tax=Flavobacterium sp. C4GT6 TaxID=3103818 RepID=UPI002ED611C1